MTAALAPATAAAAWRRLPRHVPAMIGLAALLFWVVVAIIDHWLLPDPLAGDPSHPLAHPSGAHLLGTDSLGRDVLARVLGGASSVLVVAPLATALCLVLGTLIGALAGLAGGLLDEVVMRLMDAVMAFPAIIAGMVLLGLVGKSNVTLTLLIGVVFAPLVARTVRAAVLVVRDQEYVAAARLRGERFGYLAFSEVLPNITGPLIVEGTVRLSSAIITASALSFLGLGVQPPSPDWGATIANQSSYLQTAWWSAAFPALALASLVVAVSLLAEGLKEVFDQ